MTHDEARQPRTTPNRIGFAVKVLGRTGLKSNDSRRWQSGPHLRVSIGYLDAIFDYLHETGIRMYRISSDIAPYVTHPDMPQFHGQIEECAEELAELGVKAARFDIRLSMHPAQYIVLNSPDERIAAASIRDFEAHARFLNALGCGPEAKIITHVGGVYGDRPAAMDRFIERYRALPEFVRERLVLENDEISYGLPDVLAIHGETGIPVAFDILHHRVLNPGDLDPIDACRLAHATWPTGQQPKMHYSSQRTGESGIRAGQHDDWIDGEDFVAFLRGLGDLKLDVMLEAKQKDLALFRLRESLITAGMADRIW